MAREWQKLACSTCGGRLEEKDGLLVCKNCGSAYKETEKISEEEVIALNDATMDRNRYRFDDAQEKYDLILKKFPESKEANWGAFLCAYGIIYEEDYDGKYLPTCHRLSERPIEKSPYYAKMTDEQKEKAREIEKLRLNILAETKKIKPYDVFICYKQNEEKKGVPVPTRESKWARDIYEKLTNKYKLRVFFAEKSLSRSNVDYEPHIYAALRSAKLMFVLTTSLDHLNAVWVANEWKRYVSYIRAGEEKTVRVVYDNLEPYDLPKELQAKQAIDQDSDWMAAVEAAVADVMQTAKLDRIEIKGGQMGKKSAQIQTQTLQTREIGVGIADTSVSEKQVLEIIREYLNDGQWKIAEQMSDGILYSEPNCAEALWYKFLARHKTYGKVDVLSKKLGEKIGLSEVEEIEKILQSSGKEFATELLSVLYNVVLNSQKQEDRLLQVILPYNYGHRQKMINALFAFSIKKGYYKIFKQLLATLKENQVDAYIEFNLAFARQSQNIQDRKACLDSVLGIEEGNTAALRAWVFLRLKEQDLAGAIRALEKLLSYSSNTDMEIVAVLSELTDVLESENERRFAKELIKYYQGNLKKIKAKIIILAFRLLSKKYYEDAVYFLELILSFDPNNEQAFWGICLAKLKAESEADVVNSDIPLASVSEYTKYLTLVDAMRRQACIQLTKEQDEAIERRKTEAEQNAIKKVKDEKTRKAMIVSMIFNVLGLAGCGTCTALLPSCESDVCIIFGVIGIVLCTIGGLIAALNTEDEPNKISK